MEFSKYCRLIRITEADHILTAFAVLMTNKARMWWEYAEKSLPRPIRCQAAKEVFLHKYGNIMKRQESINKLKKLYQNSMTITEFFIEAEDLNLYAGLDPETLLDFLIPGLNTALQDTLEVADLIQPITTYEQWKAKALHLGAKLEGRVKSKGNHSKSKSDLKSGGKVKSNKSEGGARKDKAKVQIPKSEKDRRMRDGECGKCRKAGHFGKDCRTGWKYDAASTSPPTESKAVTTIKKKIL